MSNRLALQNLLETALGTDNVYFQPPESVKMRYPAIKYSLSEIDIRHANNSIYKKMTAYQLVLIDEDPDSEHVDDILSLPYCSFDRWYSSDNLNHFIFTLYY